MGPGYVACGLFVIALIVPVFLYRHYVTDGGRFPARMLEDLRIDTMADLNKTKGGLLPYLTLAAGVAVAVAANQILS